jgi:hypothetical protein
MKKLSILTALMLLFSFAGFSQDEDKVDSSPAGILEYLMEAIESRCSRKGTEGSYCWQHKK